MSFHFSLDGVLRYRCGLERRERLRLQQLLAQQATVLREIERFEEQRLILRVRTQTALQGANLPGAELHFVSAQSEALCDAADRLRKQRDQLQGEIQLQSERYRSERQHREALESLRDRQLKQYQTVQQHREQAMLDELYLIRRHLTRQHLPT